MRVNVVCWSSIIMFGGWPRLSGTGRSKTCNHQMNYPRGIISTHIFSINFPELNTSKIFCVNCRQNTSPRILPGPENRAMAQTFWGLRENIWEKRIGIGGGNRSCGVFRDPAQNIIITSSFSNFPKFESPTQITFLTNVCRATPTRPAAGELRKDLWDPKHFDTKRRLVTLGAREIGKRGKH